MHSDRVLDVRCPECNYRPSNGHAEFCRAGIDESKPMERPGTSAERYFSLSVSDGDVCGPAAPPMTKGYAPTLAELEEMAGVPRACPICHEQACDHRRPPVFGSTPILVTEYVPTALPTSALARKELPLATGLLDYFPAALVAVAGVSRIGNEQHNPGKPLAWDRSKSGDEADALLRHFVERGTIDTDGLRHSTKVAWRALALLQKELEDAGLAPLSRGSR